MLPRSPPVTLHPLQLESFFFKMDVGGLKPQEPKGFIFRQPAIRGAEARQGCRAAARRMTRRKWVLIILLQAILLHPAHSGLTQIDDPPPPHLTSYANTNTTTQSPGNRAGAAAHRKDQCLRECRRDIEAPSLQAGAQRQRQRRQQQHQQQQQMRRRSWGTGAVPRPTHPQGRLITGVRAAGAAAAVAEHGLLPCLGIIIYSCCDREAGVGGQRTR